MLRFNVPFLLLSSKPELLRFVGGAALVGGALALWLGVLRRLR